MVSMYTYLPGKHAVVGVNVGEDVGLVVGLVVGEGVGINEHAVCPDFPLVHSFIAQP
jgi:hypothetical protein